MQKQHTYRPAIGTQSKIRKVQVQLQAGNEGVKAADHASPKQHWARNAGPSMHRGLDLTKAATALALVPIIGCRI
jgi:hypothetical protein